MASGSRRSSGLVDVHLWDLAPHGQQRHADRQSKPRLEPHERCQEVIDPRLDPGHGLALEDPRVQEPAGDTQGIEPGEIFRVEASLAESVGDLTLRVASVVVECAIDGSVECSEHGDQENHPSTIGEKSVEACEHGSIVIDVF